MIFHWKRCNIGILFPRPDQITGSPPKTRLYVMEDEDSSSTALGAASVLPLLSLPAPALTCVVDELLHGSKGAALHGLRGACSHLRSAANNRTRHVSADIGGRLDVSAEVQ